MFGISRFESSIFLKPMVSESCYIFRYIFLTLNVKLLLGQRCYHYLIFRYIYYYYSYIAENSSVMI